MISPLARGLALASAIVLATPAAGAADAAIAVATNFRAVMERLEADFETQSGHEITITAGSTGKLYAQIVNGAPFDVFLAADQDRPRRLEASGHAAPASRVTYAIGRLVLWDPSGDAVGPERLRAGTYRRLAIANPALAPYGAAAAQVLDALGLTDATQGKLVFGENIGQTYAFVHTRNAELGFVAAAQLGGAPPHAHAGQWAPPQRLYDPIRQDAVLLARGVDNAAARSFLAFLQSPGAQATIEQFGYVRE